MNNPWMENENMESRNGLGLRGHGNVFQGEKVGIIMVIHSPIYAE
jgi:hypothetical protein